jgi:hypothetical protein
MCTASRFGAVVVLVVFPDALRVVVVVVGAGDVFAVVSGVDDDVLLLLHP